ncbi:MAG: hypothetical protein JRJ44_04385 [Deltaproteobacteria bacterium]|nr:hypothetical protein [Deltaproteobacteria bacterium]
MIDNKKEEQTIEEILCKKFKKLKELVYSYKGLELIMKNIESVIENPRKGVINIFTIGKKKPYLIPLKEKKTFFNQLDSLLMIRKAFRYKYKNLHILLDNVEAVSEVSEENKLRIYMRGGNKTYIIPLDEKESFLACMTVCLTGKKHLLENIEYRFVNQRR